MVQIVNGLGQQKEEAIVFSEEEPSETERSTSSEDESRYSTSDNEEDHSTSENETEHDVEEIRSSMNRLNLQRNDTHSCKEYRFQV